MENTQYPPKVTHMDKKQIIQHLIRESQMSVSYWESVFNSMTAYPLYKDMDKQHEVILNSLSNEDGEELLGMFREHEETPPLQMHQPSGMLTCTPIGLTKEIRMNMRNTISNTIIRYKRCIDELEAMLEELAEQENA
jgi:hypothetical protein